jgi:hypothetical protein
VDGAGAQLHLPTAMPECEQNLVVGIVIHEADRLAAEPPQQFCDLVAGGNAGAGLTGVRPPAIIGRPLMAPTVIQALQHEVKSQPVERNPDFFVVDD